MGKKQRSGEGPEGGETHSQEAASTVGGLCFTVGHFRSGDGSASFSMRLFSLVREAGWYRSFFFTVIPVLETHPWRVARLNAGHPAKFEFQIMNYVPEES